MINKTKILDCTLRDGGYYTNWDFNKKTVTDYCKLMENLPVDYVEVGYRSIELEGYLGEYFYTPEYLLKELKELMPSKKIVIILNEKDIRKHHLNNLLTPCKPFVTMIRLAIDPINLERAIILAKEIKLMGFEVGFNLMYMSTWKDSSTFINNLTKLDSIIDFLYMVDSFGGVTPKKLAQIINLIQSKTNVPLGFHGHNNLELALANTITAINEGCVIVDSTITGMGRGAGNLRTELLLTYFDSTTKIDINYTRLGKVVSDFEKLKSIYKWGTNLPYIFSGANSLSQKQVMEWVSMNRYPMSSILRALKDQKENPKQRKLPLLDTAKTYNRAIILGGGHSAENSFKGVKKFVENNNDTCVIHAGVKNIIQFLNVEVKQYYILVGFESEKLLNQIDDFSKIKNDCIFPPSPRKQGTIIPVELLEVSNEIKKIEFTNLETDSPLCIAIQTALDLGANILYFVGFDGYNSVNNQNQFILAKENQSIFNDLTVTNPSLIIRSITPTKYENIKVTSIYSLL